MSWREILQVETLASYQRFLVRYRRTPKPTSEEMPTLDTKAASAEKLIIQKH